MYEIELKAHVQNPQTVEKRLGQCADFASECVKKDTYWRINGKPLRIREEQQLPSGTSAVYITNKIRTYHNAIEVNKELEFELPEKALADFSAMLENIGFTCFLKKEKHTKVFIPHRKHFDASLLTDMHSFSIELSTVPPLGSFLEIELLYPDDSPSADTQSENNYRTICINRAEKILHTMLGILNIEDAAIEKRCYAELLAEAAAKN